MWIKTYISKKAPSPACFKQEYHQTFKERISPIKLQSKEKEGVLSHAFEETDVTLKFNLDFEHMTKG